MPTKYAATKGKKTFLHQQHLRKFASSSSLTQILSLGSMFRMKLLLCGEKKCIIMFVFLKASFKHISNHSQKGEILGASRWDVTSYSQEVHRSASQYFSIC